MQHERLIGRYEGTAHGPLLIVFGGMHGNEPAGVKALETMFQMLELEPRNNPLFEFNGLLLGVRGNCRAMQDNKRFVNKDLNRQWTIENVARIKASPPEELDSEDLEIKEILAFLDKEISAYQPSNIVVLDMHTTTAFGGIFSICTDEPESERIAVELHAPVIKGMLKGIKGTSLHYFCTKNFGVETVAVCFESGQHNEKLSVHRAIAAITNCMRTVGCVKAEHIENRHDSILIEYSTGLPKISQLIMVHPIKSGDNFRMTPNYKNFQAVKKGEILAQDRHGNILAREDGLVLMPLYQKQGDDGFFLIKMLEAF